MYSSFIDNLMNMKYGAKDAAEDISEYFMRAMLSNKIGEMYSDKLKAGGRSSARPWRTTN